MKAVKIVNQKRPDIVIDGEMHLDTAVVEEIVRDNYPHSRTKGDANVLIFPDLTSGNIGYKLVQRLGRAEAVGPVLMAGARGLGYAADPYAPVRGALDRRHIYHRGVDLHAGLGAWADQLMAAR